MAQTLPKNILLIDDDHDDMVFYLRALNSIDPSMRLQYEVDGVDAITMLNAPKANLPDIIFLDLNMPRMNGKEFLAEVKAASHLKHIPVVIYSTSKRDLDVKDAQKLGATGFMTKPVSFNELVTALRFTLFEKHAAGEYLNARVEVF